MPRPLRQSTAVDVPIGPFQSPTDGTVQTGLTITQPDVQLKKNAAAWAQKSAAQTLAHETNGFYEVTLSTTDTDTLGLLRLSVNETGALPVWEDFVVMSQAVYDALYGTGFLQVDVTRWLNTAVATPTTAGIPRVAIEAAGDFIQAAADKVWASATRTLTAFSTVLALSVWDVLEAAIVTASSIGLKLKTNLDATVSSRSTYAGADTAGTTTILSRIIGTLAAGTHQPQSGDSFTRLGAPVGASHSADVAAVQADTDNLQTRLPAALVGGRMDASVGAYPGNTAQTGDTFARIGAPTGVSVSADVAAVKSDTTAINTAVDTEVAAIKAKTDQLVFSTANRVDSTVVDKTGFALSTAGNNAVRDAVTDDIIETQGNYTLQQALSVLLAVVGGRTDTGGLVFRSPNGTSVRVTATVDASNNRTGMTLTPSA